MSIKSKVEAEVESEVETEVADSEVENVETVDAEVDDTAEILEDAKELAENEQSEVKEDETPEESVRQALKDISKDKSAGDKDQEEKPEASKTADPAVKEGKGKPAPKKETSYDPELAAPDALKLEHKELFNAQPEPLRREINRVLKGMQAEMTRAQQDSAKVVKEWNGLAEAVQPFAREFAKQGVTIPQGVLALLASHEALTNPKSSREAFIALGNELKLLNENSIKALRGQTGQNGETTSGNVDLASNPEFQALKEENKRLREMVEPLHNGVKQSQEQKESAIVEAITTELQSVINEMDGSGRYLNPKLHEPEFLDSWKQLTAAIARTDKTVKSWKEAGKKAYDRMTGRSSSAGSVTPSSRNNRSVSAAVSVRGRTAAPSAMLQQDEPEVPANETPEQSARAALADLRRGL